MRAIELLLALAPGAPLLLAVLWPLRVLRSRLAAFAPWAAAPALLLALLPAADGVEIALPSVMLGFHLALDSTGRTFLLFTALLWLVCGAFARSYHAEDPRRTAFFGFFVLTMAGNIGLVVAGDVVSFYLFFAVMTFAAYGMVVHRRDREALRAGRVYIVMAVLGEVSILVGLFALGWAAMGPALFGAEVQTAWAVLDRHGMAGLVAALLIGGFGVKAGLVPLHLWLPLAHPVAPTAASALLSGAMIKAGLLAWLRFLPEEVALPGLGAGLIAAGAAAALYGVVVGVVQDDAKTVLAYSSVSQMGYMTMGVGLLVREPGWAPAALLAVVLYAFHHGMAKGALFLSVGVGDRACGARPGGTLRKRLDPWRAAVVAGALFPALALAGAPLSSGALAKASLKGALRDVGGGWYPVLDPLLFVAAAGTTLLMARFLFTLDDRLRRAEAEGQPDPEGVGERGAWETWGTALPWALLIAIGATSGIWLLPVMHVPVGIDLPGAAGDPLGALLPLLLAVVLAWVVWLRPDRLGRLGMLRIPAGDLVVPAERVAGWAAVLMRRGAERLGTGSRLEGARAGAFWVGALWGERDARLHRGSPRRANLPDAGGWDASLSGGPALGLLFFGLALALGFLLLW